MRTACILYLIISNSFCLGYRLQDNELKKNYKLHLEKETNIKNTPAIKEVLSSQNKNMSDLQYTEIEPSNNYDISDVYTVDERQNQIKSKKKSTESPLKMATNDVFCKTTTCLKRTSKDSLCQHIHLHLNGTRGEERTVWRFSCLTLFVLIIIIVLLLNCFHYHYGLGVYYKKCDESESYDEQTTGYRETKRLLGP